MYIYERIYKLMTLKSLSPAQISPELWLPLEITRMTHRDLQDTYKQTQVYTDQRGQSCGQESQRRICQNGPDKGDGA